MIRQIDLNCDMGEGILDDAILMDYITSANIACGFHAGDLETMEKAVDLALRKGVAIGAHPGLADKRNFGRIETPISAAEVYRISSEQIQSLYHVVKRAGGELHHVKPHGALYNMAARDAVLAGAIAQSVYDFDRNMILYALAGSEMIIAAAQIGLVTASEVFADRSYQHDGSLTPRGQTNALITDQKRAIDQVLMMVKQQQVISADNKTIPLKAETLCLHSDGAHAVAFAKTISSRLKSEGILLKVPAA